MSIKSIPFQMQIQKYKILRRSTRGISHTITPISYTITPISHTISESVEMGVLL